MATTITLDRGPPWSIGKGRRVRARAARALNAIGAGAVPAFGMLIAAALVVSRRPDAVTHAQFWAEDGASFYTNVYQHGVFSTLTLPVGGYLNILPVLVTGLAQTVQLTQAPLVMNLAAIAIQVLPVGLLLSRRATAISPSLPVRVVLSALYVGLPGAASVNANITDAMIHMAIAAALVLTLAPPRSAWTRAADAAILLLCGLTGVFSIVLAPLAWIQRRRLGDDAVPRWIVMLLALCASVQLLCVGVFSTHLPGGFVAAPRSRIPLEASAHGFWQILGGRVLAPPIVGIGPAASVAGNVAIVGVGVLGLAGAYLAVRNGPPPLQLFVLFGLGMLVLALIDPLQSTWLMLSEPPIGERYFVIPQLAVLATLVWAVGPGRPRLIRGVAMAALTATVVLAVPGGWSYPPYAATRFTAEAQRFDHAKPGTVVTLQINPLPWQMTLIKH